MQYCSLQHQTLLLHQSHSQWVLSLLWLHPFTLSGVISPLVSSSILGTYRSGEFVFQCPIFLPFPTVHGVLKARILKWFAIPFSSGPQSVRPLHHDPSVLGGPTWHGLVSLHQTRLCGPCDQTDQFSVIMVSVCLLSDASRNTYQFTWVFLTLDIGYLFTISRFKKCYKFATHIYRLINSNIQTDANRDFIIFILKSAMI